MPKSSKNPFDTMFVIFCVIAGASSHMISNSSKVTQNLSMHHHYRTSIIDLILDPGLVDVVAEPKLDIARNLTEQYLETLNDTSLDQIKSRSSDDMFPVCSTLSNILSGSQLKFCQKHEELLRLILPQIIRLTKRECSKLTSDLRWTCASLAPFLDRSSSLAFTREAALIRSILNASMMYLTINVCNGRSYHSCGCGIQGMQDSINQIPNLGHFSSSILGDIPHTSNAIIDQVQLSRHEVDKLKKGSPLRLSRSMIKHQGCDVNIVFADAFTRIFLDAEDTKSLNKAFKVLNEDHNKSKSKYSSEKRIMDSDYRDLSFIKWTKSAVSLHNNHVGRQIVRRYTLRQCRCHGISGACQFRTCWNKLPDFSELVTKLKEIYMSKSFMVSFKNFGSHEKPDLCLRKIQTGATSIGKIPSPTEKEISIVPDSLGPGEFAFIHDSPDYCEAQPIIEHPGTRDRPCSLSPEMVSDTDQRASGTSSRSSSGQNNSNTPAGSCAYICCNRGFRSELGLYAIDCNCRFRFCCKVECETCLRQRMRHYCS